MFYYAYGANLNIEIMNYRCPRAKRIINLTLPNHKLVFKGVADIETSYGDNVEGVLWDISDEWERSLDIFEGFPHLYRKEYFTIKADGAIARDYGNVIDVMVYKMNRDGYGQPSDMYLETIRNCYEANGLDFDCLWDAYLHSRDNHTPSFYRSNNWGA